MIKFVIILANFCYTTYRNHLRACFKVIFENLVCYFHFKDIFKMMKLSTITFVVAFFSATSAFATMEDSWNNHPGLIASAKAPHCPPQIMIANHDGSVQEKVLAPDLYYHNKNKEIDLGT